MPRPVILSWVRKPEIQKCKTCGLALAGAIVTPAHKHLYNCLQEFIENAFVMTAAKWAKIFIIPVLSAVSWLATNPQRLTVSANTHESDCKWQVRCPSEAGCAPMTRAMQTLIHLSDSVRRKDLNLIPGSPQSAHFLITPLFLAGEADLDDGGVTSAFIFFRYK